MIEITSWGKSMYGGWYANFYKDGEYTGTHANTKKELQQKCGVPLDKSSRSDN